MFRKRDEIDSTSRYHLPPRGGCRLGFGGLIQAVKNQDLYTKGSQNSISWKDNKMALQFYKFVTYKYNTNLIHLQLCKISKIISYAQHSSSLYVHRCNENWDTKQKKKKAKRNPKITDCVVTAVTSAWYTKTQRFQTTNKFRIIRLCSLQIVSIKFLTDSSWWWIIEWCCITRQFTTISTTTTLMSHDCIHSIKAKSSASK